MPQPAQPSHPLGGLRGKWQGPGTAAARGATLFAMGRHKIISDEKLLSIARDVFVEQGIGASTRAIARRAGMSEAAIYQRFATKMDLFFAAMVPPALDIDSLLSCGEVEGGLLPRLEGIGVSLLDYFRTLIPILLPLMSHPSFDFETFAARHPDSPLGRLRLDLRNFMKAQAAVGALGADPDAAALAFFSSLFSVAFFERFGTHGGTFPPSIVREMIRVLWRGMAPDSS